MTREALGNKISELRKEKGYSIREMAERCDLSKSTIANLEKGRFSPRYDILEKILQSLDAKFEIKASEPKALQIDDKVWWLLGNKRYEGIVTGIAVNGMSYNQKKVVKTYIVCCFNTGIEHCFTEGVIDLHKIE